MIFNIIKNDEIVVQYDLTELIDDIVEKHPSQSSIGNLDRDTMNFSSESEYLSYTFYVMGLSGKIESGNYLFSLFFI